MMNDYSPAGIESWFNGTVLVVVVVILVVFVLIAVRASGLSSTNKSIFLPLRRESSLASCLLLLVSPREIFLPT